ncbi:hypothetical protein NDU88_003001 [Pleurodeles waltl]|uniref:Uncharacterized protein n=1 Tax=Pleurodeles waltl TaxID=8319 RepID=A0AAV7VG09_PLEWA|nr:hypothetical protein NDU88_003001 [Pleurodeles waltl]
MWQQSVGLRGSPQCARVQFRPRNIERNPGTSSPTRRCSSNPWGYVALFKAATFRSGPETKMGILGTQVPPGDVAAIRRATRRTLKRLHSGPETKTGTPSPTRRRGSNPQGHVVRPNVPAFRSASWDLESHQETWQQSRVHAACPKAPAFRSGPETKTGILGP